MISLEKVRTAVDFNDVLARSPVRNIPGADRTLRDTLTKSVVVWVGKVDGEIACVWGLIPPTLISRRAYLWMYSTDAVADHKFVFVRHSQRVIEKMLERYDSIVGHCLVGARDSIRWVRWLGGVFGETNGHFMPFTIERRQHG